MKRLFCLGEILESNQTIAEGRPADIPVLRKITVDSARKRKPPLRIALPQRAAGPAAHERWLNLSYRNVMRRELAGDVEKRQVILPLMLLIERQPGEYDGKSSRDDQKGDPGFACNMPSCR